MLFFGVIVFSMSGSPAFADDEVAPASTAAVPADVAATRGVEPYRTATKCAKDGVAVGGYDLVSYRDADGPRLGRAEFSVEYGGGIYLFASAGNREKFLADPIQYLPHYGGWCAISMALGQKVCPNASNFKIEEGDLLLFRLTAFTNGRSLWNTDPAKYRQQADVNYQRFMRE